MLRDDRCPHRLRASAFVARAPAAGQTALTASQVVFLLYQKKEGTQAQDRAIDDFTLKGR
jgi:hypothetical protein